MNPFKYNILAVALPYSKEMGEIPTEVLEPSVSSTAENTQCDRLAIKIFEKVIASKMRRVEKYKPLPQTKLAKRGEGLYMSIIKVEKSWRGNGMISMCQECSTLSPKAIILEDDVWKSIAKDPRGLLCMHCIEEALGKPIDVSVMKDVPLNITEHYDLMFGSALDPFGSYEKLKKEVE